MDKKLILAVAGSGKTRLIIDSLDTQASNIIIGYTNANIESIKTRLIRRFGAIPKKTKVMPFFSFLYTYCYRPVLARKLKTKGLFFETPPFKGPKRKTRNYYITSKGYIYHSRLSLLLLDAKVMDRVIYRINTFVDHLYIDEVQDFSSHDFDLIINLHKLSIPVTCVGDFFQHTFNTSTDRGKRKNLFSDFSTYSKEFVDNRWVLDTNTLSDSYRCSPTICEFITKNLKINIGSHRKDYVELRVITDVGEAVEIISNSNIIKLFYSKHKTQNCYSNNWGLSKGVDKYKNVCVIMTGAIEKAMNLNDFSGIAPMTLNKFYVACTRANGNLYFISSKLLKNAQNTAATPSRQ